MEDTSNVKLPSISVIVPLVVPFSTTLAPAMGPSASSITPLILCFACCGEATIGVGSTEPNVPIDGFADAIPIDARNIEAPKNIALDT